MEVAVDLDESLARELAEEANIHGFGSREAYVRWILAHRPSSDLSAQRQPTLASRLSTLEERMTVVERQVGLDGTADPDADLSRSGSSAASGGGVALESEVGGGDLPGTADPDGDPVDQQGNDDGGGDAAAEDDDIAAAIDSISLEDGED